MSKKCWNVIMAGMILMGGVGRSCDAAFPDSTETTPKIIVYLINRAGIDRIVLERTGSVVTRIFREAGVEAAVHSLDGEDVGSDATMPQACQFYVFIVPWKTVKVLGLQQHEMALGTVLGNPDEGDPRIVYVFDRLDQLLREKKEADESLIMGYAIAHEIGHILLHRNSHSQSGIMQAVWDRKAIRGMTTGALAFIAEECVRIQADVARRSLGNETQVSFAPKRVR